MFFLGRCEIYKGIATFAYSEGQEGFREDENPHAQSFAKNLHSKKEESERVALRNSRSKALRVNRKSAQRSNCPKTQSRI
jgi:hypothetical protein